MRFCVVSEGAGRRREGELAGAPLAVPVEAVFLLPFIHRAAEKLLQDVEVDLPLGDGFRKQSFQPFDVLRKNIGGLGFRIT
jgi:hypothetical protein